MYLSVDKKRPLTSLNNAKTNERNRMKSTEVPGVYNQAISRFRLKREPARNVFLHAHENVHNLVK